MNANNESESMSLREIYLQASDKAAPEERAAFLAEVCGKNSSLRSRVEALLERDPEDDFLENPAVDLDETQEDPVTERPGVQIGRYKLLEKLGQGGFGAVWAAEQKEPIRRRVALKIIKLGMDTSQVVARFEAERQALALMDHPNIARVLDAGATDNGRPYFVMELVKGISVTKYCDQERLTTKERLDLFIKISHAVQHAHQKGLIHRDIKPSNIMVTLHDGVPVPKVIDFGIAKATQQELTEKTIYTQYSQFIGTPAYMSPEQAEMSGLDIDTRSDIYSLGVLLYELLTGATPFDSKELAASGIDEMRRIIREKEPQKPSTRVVTLQNELRTTTARQRSSDVPRLINLLRGDLDWIVMKCLEKDRTRRYDTANGLAMDLKRHLENAPVTARPPSALYRFQKAWKRNKVVYTAAMVAAVAVLTGLVVSIWQSAVAIEARRTAEAAQIAERNQLRRAEQERAVARMNAYASDMNLTQQAIEANNFGRAYQLLFSHIPGKPEDDLRGWEWRHLWQKCQSDAVADLRAADARIVWSVAISPTDQNIVACTTGSVVEIRHGSSGTPITLAHPKEVSGLAFSPDGSILASGCVDNKVRFWDPQTGYQTRTAIAHSGLVEDLAFVASGSTGLRLAVRTDGEMSVWNLLPTESVMEALYQSGFEPTTGLPSTISASPDGRWIATGRGDDLSGIALFDLESESRLPLELLVPASQVVDVAFAPGGRELAAVDWDGRLSVFNFEDGRWVLSRSLQAHDVWISSVSYLDDGNRLITAGADQLIKLWDVATLEVIRTFKGHHDEIWSMDTTSDGQFLVTAAKDGAVKRWQVHATASSKITTLEFPDRRRFFCSSGRRFIAGLDSQFMLSLYETRDLERVASFPLSEDVTSLAIADEARLLATGHENGAIQLFLLDQSMTPLRALDGHAKPVRSLEFSHDGRWLISLAGDGAALLWNVSTGEGILPLEDVWSSSYSGAGDASPFSFSEDDRLFVVPVARTRTVEIWNIPGLRRVSSHRLPRNDFSAGSRILSGNKLYATAGTGGYLTVRDVSGDTYFSREKGQLLGLHAIAVSPDGARIAVGTSREGVRLWFGDGSREMLILESQHDITDLTFSPDGNSLVACSAHQLTLFRAPSWTELGIVGSAAQK